MTEYHVLKHFPSWREAVRAAGLRNHAQPISPLIQSFSLKTGEYSSAKFDEFQPEISIDATEDTALESSRKNLVLGQVSRPLFVPLRRTSPNGTTLSHYYRFRPQEVLVYQDQ